MKKYWIYFLCLGTLCVSGCEDFLSVGVPKDQLVSESVFESDSHASAALMGIYAQMYNNGNNTYNIPFQSGLASDELTNHSTNGGAVLLYQNDLQAFDALTNSFWNNGYNFIYQANAIQEGCDESSSLSPALKRQLMAEASFIRAFWYFYLVNFYGAIPILTTTDYKSNARASRSPVSEVYKLIITDLIYAADNLNPGYVDKTGLNIYNERVRPNQAAAQALLARVFLFDQKWREAEEFSTKVIENKDLYDIVPLNEVFLKNNRAAIWQLPPVVDNNLATQEGKMFILTARPLSNALNNCSSLSPQMLAAFDYPDKRMQQWVGQFSDTSGTDKAIYYFPYKYKIRESSNPLEYSTVLRLAEQYLIRAEARVRLGDINGAIDDLNFIRSRAEIEDVTTRNAEELLGLILHERQVELFTEWGHRWLDLKRTGQVHVVMSHITPEKGGGNWVNFKQWWPIPRNEVENNPNLEQNPGYN